MSPFDYILVLYLTFQYLDYGANQWTIVCCKPSWPSALLSEPSKLVTVNVTMFTMIITRLVVRCNFFLMANEHMSKNCSSTSVIPSVDRKLLFLHVFFPVPFPLYTVNTPGFAQRIWLVVSPQCPNSPIVRSLCSGRRTCTDVMLDLLVVLQRIYAQKSSQKVSYIQGKQLMCEIFDSIIHVLFPILIHCTS